MRQLTPSEQERYKRHLMLPEVGAEGQAKLLSSRVLVVGAGGLGSPVLQYLAAAGVGHIGICDADNVDLSNLQRQVIHNVAAIGTPKTLSAERAMRGINPDVAITLHNHFLSPENAAQIIADYDFIVDATDGFAAKSLINDTCVALGKPYSHGSIREFEGQLFTYTPGNACYRCIYGDLTDGAEMPKASEYGLFGVIAGIVGTLQAAEAIKYLCGVGALLTNRLLCVDAHSMAFTTIDISPDKACCCQRG